MTAPITACYVASLNQQREQAIERHKQCSETAIEPCKTKLKTCTMVENGKVIVKQVPAKVDEPIA